MEAANKAEAEGDNVYGHGFGFDVSGIDKGKGKAKILNIYKDAEMSNATPKESMESSTTSSSNFSFVHAHYPDPLGFIKADREKASCSNPSGSDKSSSSIPSGSDKSRCSITSGSDKSNSSIPSGSDKSSSSIPSGNDKSSCSSSSTSESYRINRLYYSNKYPLAPLNSPTTTQEDITGASGSGGSVG
jgi:hypothetical protein